MKIHRMCGGSFAQPRKRTIWAYAQTEHLRDRENRPFPQLRMWSVHICPSGSCAQLRTGTDNSLKRRSAWCCVGLGLTNH